MVVGPNFRLFNTVLAIGTGTGVTAYYFQKLRDPQQLVYNSWFNNRDNDPINPCAIWDTDWDYREIKSFVKPTMRNSKEQIPNNTILERSFAKAARHIILVQHGEYLDKGDTDETHKLTERGRLQAIYTGKRLHELGIKWNEIIASTQTRAQETAEIILKEINYDPKRLVSCNLLREGAPVSPQPPVSNWAFERSQFFRDGARIEAGFRRYFYRAHPDEQFDTYTLIVGHGNVIRYFVCRALQFAPEGYLRMNINHGSITWLTINPSGNVTIKCLGDTGFMPVNYLTDVIPKEEVTV